MHYFFRAYGLYNQIDLGKITIEIVKWNSFLLHFLRPTVYVSDGVCFFSLFHKTWRSKRYELPLELWSTNLKVKYISFINF